MVVEWASLLDDALLASMRIQLETAQDPADDNERIGIGKFEHAGREYCIEVRIRAIGLKVEQ